MPSPTANGTAPAVSLRTVLAPERRSGKPRLQHNHRNRKAKTSQRSRKPWMLQNRFARRTVMNLFQNSSVRFDRLRTKGKRPHNHIQHNSTFNCEQYNARDLSMTITRPCGTIMLFTFVFHSYWSALFPKRSPADTRIWRATVMYAACSRPVFIAQRSRA